MAIELSQSDPNPSGIKPISAEHGSKILFNGLRFSQGDRGLFVSIAEYFHTAHPTWQVEDQKTIVELCRQRVGKFFGPADSPLKLHAPIEPSAWQRQVAEEADVLTASLNSSVFEPINETLAHIASAIIGADRWLYYRRLKDPQDGYKYGRYREVPETKRNNSYMQDRWMSHFKHYVIDGNQTELPEYDEMFADVKRFWEAKIQEDPIWNPNVQPDYMSLQPGKSLAYIIQVWEKTHPDLKYLS
jgi:hypothetical protein